MTSQLNVDTIVDKAGSGGSNIKIANTSTYVAEGGSATQNSVQGLTKAWIKFNSTDASAYDSFNHSTTSDNGTGRTQCNLTNAMSSASNSCTSADNGGLALISNQVTMTTSTYSSDHFTTGGSFQDVAFCSAQMNGDLA
jgi:hypothetical protein|tara:strand:- start:577 stop:993 length:417 start_codon:yes stop_codon:yes gene_type:complete